MLRRGVLLLGGSLESAERLGQTASDVITRLVRRLGRSAILDEITRLSRILGRTAVLDRMNRSAGSLGRTSLVQGKQATMLRRAVLLVVRVAKCAGMLRTTLLWNEGAIFCARLRRVALLVNDPRSILSTSLRLYPPILSTMPREAALLVNKPLGL